MLEQPECRSIAKVSWDEVPTKYHIETTSKRISQARIIGGRTLLSFQAYLSYGSSLGVRQEKDLNVTKDSIEVKDLLSIQSIKSKLNKKFTFIDEMIKVMHSCSKPGLLPTARLLLGVQFHLAHGGVGRLDYHLLDYYSHEYFHFYTNGGWAD